MNARTAAITGLFGVSNSTATVTGPASGPKENEGAVRKDHSWRRQSLTQRLDAAPVEKSWLHQGRQSSVTSAANAAQQGEMDLQVEVDTQAAPAPVQSGKVPKRASVVAKAEQTARDFIHSLLFWKTPSLTETPLDLLKADLQEQCKALRGEKKALTNSLWKRWFSPPHRRAAAILQKTLNEAENSILEALTKKNTATNLFGNALDTLFPDNASNQTLPEDMSTEPSLAELERILTSEWGDAWPGLAALATQIAKVRVYQEKDEQSRNDNTVGKSLRERRAETKNRVRLANDAYNSVPPHLRNFVKQDVLKPAGLEKFIGLRRS